MNRKILSLSLAAGLALILLPALFSIFSKAQIVHAATFVVDTTVDENDGSCDDDCSIRDAVTLSAGGDTISIPAGTYPLSDTLGELTVAKTLIFSGTGSTAADVVIEAGADARLFNISNGTSTFFNVTLQNGNPIGGSGGAINAIGGASLVIDSTIITGNNAPSNGGGIAFTNGSLTLTNSQILSNTAGNNGGGIYSNNGSITLGNSQVLTNAATFNGGGIALNLASANLVMNSGQVNDNSASLATNAFPGGGIFVASGSATINDGEIRNNLARRGGGILVTSGSVIINGGQVIDNEADYGGGVYVRNESATLTINGGEITENRSVDPSIFGGGGLYIFQGLATLNDGEISFNTALNDGGALEIGDALGRFTQTGGTISNNSAGNMGGAIYSSEGTLTISGGTIHTNDSMVGGGAIATDATSNSTISNSAILTNTTPAGTPGGGIKNDGTLTMTNVTLSGNDAGNGAGLQNTGTTVLTNVTVSGNTATTSGGGLSNSGGTLTVGNSIIFDNTGGSECTGTITTAGNNINNCGLAGSGDSNSPPMLQPLALNGGDTLNYALGVGSSAIDEGNPATCPATDQRGNLRPIDGDGDDTATCDIGAYEDGIGFFISDASLTEGNTGNDQMSFTVSRSFMTSTTYTVTYATVDGTALAGMSQDYLSNSGTLTFLPAAMTQTIDIDIVGDTLDEFDETFTVELTDQSPETQLGDTSGTGTILDDDAPPSLTIDDVTLTEGNIGTATAFFTATLSTASGKEITVDYTTMDGTAVSSLDYVAASDTLTFTPGTLTQTFSININSDSLDEFDENFTVELSNESNVTLTDSSALVTITDDDAEPTISIDDVSVTEGNSGTTTASFVVNLSAASGKEITVDYAATANTATAGTDFVSASDTLTITPGLSSETISITVNGDVVDEFDETFEVDLSNANNVLSITDDNAVGTINDDDALPTATISDATVTEGDSGTIEAEFTVTLSAASEKTITINYSSASGSATAGEDYTAVANTLTFNPGDPLSQIISVTVNGDEDTEQDEQFFINFAGSSNVTLGNSQGIGTITNDDGTFIFLPFIVKP